MTPSRLEARLRSETQPDEAAFAPRPLPASIGSAAERISRSSGTGLGGPLLVVMAAAIAGVAFLAVTGWLPRGPQPGLGDGSSEAPTTVASPTDGEGQCRPADLRLGSEAWGGAAGSRGTILTVGLATDTSCRLPEPVAVQILDGAGAVLVEATSAGNGDVRLDPGVTVQVGISWSNWCDPAPSPTVGWNVRFGTGPRIDATEPGAPVSVPPCLGTGGSSLSVTGFRPVP